MSSVNTTEWIKASISEDISTQWKLTALDAAASNFIIRGTWVFSSELDIDKLKKSLSIMLSYVPHMAGRIIKGRLERNNAGIPFSTASIPNIKISDFNNNQTLAEQFADRPNLRKAKRGKEPLMKVKLTSIKDGVVLSICSLHALHDGSSFFTMITNWGLIFRGKTPIEQSLDQSNMPKAEQKISKVEAIQRATQAGWTKFSVFKLLLRLPHIMSRSIKKCSSPIFISNDVFQKLKHIAVQESSDCLLSNNDVISAYLSKKCAQLYTNNEDITYSQAIVIDFRKYLPEIPLNYFGNASFVVKGAEFKAHESLGSVAKRTHDCLEPYLQKPSTALSEEINLSLELGNYNKFHLPYDFFSLFHPKPNTFYISNLSNAPIYSLDFGDDDTPIKPVFVAPPDNPVPILVWPAPPESKGVEIYISGLLTRTLEKKGVVEEWKSELLALSKTCRDLAS